MAQAPEQPQQQSESKSSSPKSSKMHRRSRSGCFTCRLRRKKCSENKPICLACRNLGLCCDWKRPSWWANNDTRRAQKDLIKSQIKRTKTTEKETMKVPSSSRHQSMPPPDMYDLNGQRAGSEDSYDEVDPVFAGTPGYYDPHAQQYYGAPITDMYGYTYEVDVKTERQIWLNDIPTRTDSSISTFNTFIPPPPAHSVLPSYQGDFVQQFETPIDNWNGQEAFDFNFLDYSGQQLPLSTHTGQIEVEEWDQPLLNHLIENVLPLMFPVRQTNQQDVKSDVILPALETNKAYLHVCLSAAAEHMKSLGINTETNDHDSARHIVAFVTESVTAMQDPNSFLSTLEATLAALYLPCVIGSAESAQQSIGWRGHFEAIKNFAENLQMPQLLLALPAGKSGEQTPFSMSLTAWIDIIGATMKCEQPAFSDYYRERHLADGGRAGLYELMGCSDDVMFLLSEAACLDSLKAKGMLNDYNLCTHVSALGGRINSTESPGEQFCYPYSSSGSFRPRQLSRNITAIYRKAVRLYLLGLIPTYDRYSAAAVDLVQDIFELVQFIPSGPEGYDRSVIWPLLIAGSASIPGSPFRKLFSDRTAKLGIAGSHGNFGRLVKVLQEVWKRNDEISLSATVCEATPVTAGASPGPLLISRHETPIQPRIVHWRDVMRENGWDYLLL